MEGLLLDEEEGEDEERGGRAKDSSDKILMK